MPSVKMIPTLTRGAITRIMNGEDIKEPILQIFQMKRMVPEGVNAAARVKLGLTDGPSKIVAMTASQLNEQFSCEGGAADNNSIIKLTNYKYQCISDRKILIVVEFELMAIGRDVGRCLLLEENGSAAAEDNSKRPLESNYNSGNAKGRPTTMGQPAAGAGNRNAPSNFGQNANVHPIDSLTPYQNNVRWCIRARVTSKRDIRTYSNQKGEGKLFSIDLADDSGEIRATGFNAECDRFFNMLLPGQVYYIRNGSIKTANRQWSSINNDYELTFNAETQIEQCHDDNSFKLPMQKFSFVPLGDIVNRPKEGLIDVIGIVDSASQCETITSKQSQKEFQKRTVRLIDDTKCSITLTLWGKDAENFDCSGDNAHPILAVKGVRISDFQGLSLSAAFGAEVLLNPDHPDAHKLRGWYDAHGSNESFQSLTTGATGSGGGGPAPYMLIAISEADRLGTGDKPDYFTVKGTISAIKSTNCLYKACPTADCNKKMIEIDGSSFRCEKCNKEFATFKWRLMLAAQIYDFSGQIWVTFFQDMAEMLLGTTTDVLGNLKENDEEAFNAVFTKAAFNTFMFRLKAKMETFNDETRVKCTGVKVDPMNYAEYSRYLIDDIRRIEAMPNLA